MGAEVIEKHFTIDNDLPGEIINLQFFESSEDLSLFISNRKKMLIDHGLDFKMEKKIHELITGKVQWIILVL